MKLNSFYEVEQLTKSLVAIPSINGSINGEKKVAQFIVDYFKDYQYFKDHPDYLFTFCVNNDNANRLSTIAFIKGNSNKTIILMNHIDTVDIGDYGKAIDYAFNPDLLPDKLMELFDLNDEVIKDINSNEYMFARGALDMKSGVAANMFVFKYYLEHIDELNGSLLLLSECDEEGESQGIISALDKLIELKQKEDLEYIACINTDFTTALNNKDNNRYVHIGTVGKLLPCFAVFGKEVHVGKAFDGFDPNLLLSMITKEISFNTELCDIDINEATIPPVSLKQCDFKDSYTVQTALSSLGYYNYLTYKSNPKEVISKCKKVAEKAFDETINYLNEQYEKYCKLNSFDFEKLPWKTSVYSYREWHEKMSKENKNFEKEMNDFAERLNKDYPTMDLRLFGYKLIEKAYSYSKEKEPCVIIFLGTMYYSSNSYADEKLINCVKKAISNIENESKRNIVLAKYYPYISDMSFMSINGDDKAIEDLLLNSPQHGVKYFYPYQKIKSINVPVINIGTYGKDGHQFTERVEKWHTFQNVPNLLYETINELLK